MIKTTSQQFLKSPSGFALDFSKRSFMSSIYITFLAFVSWAFDANA